MICQFVKKIVSIVTFAVYTIYTYGTLADAWVKKDKRLENKESVPWTQVTFLDF